LLIAGLYRTAVTAEAMTLSQVPSS
jgi:hypothetical protein